MAGSEDAFFEPDVFDVVPVGASAWDAASPPAAGAIAADPVYLRSLESSLAALKAGKRRGRRADDSGQLTALIAEQLRAAPSHAAHRSASERAAAGDVELASLLGRSSSSSSSSGGGRGGDESGSEIAAVTLRCTCLKSLHRWWLAQREWIALRRRRQIFTQLAALEEEPDDRPSGDSDDDGWQS